MRRVISDTIAVFGEGHSAASVGLRNALRHRNRSETALVLDYTGRGAMLLGKDHRLELGDHRMSWYDVADRRRPVALYQFRRSTHFRRIVLKTLHHIRRISGLQVEDSTLVWAAEATYELSADGTVGLGALLRSISSPEVRNWFLSTQANSDDIGLLIEILSWAFHFPAVYAVSEGSNSANLCKDLIDIPVTWIECRIEYFESSEYALVAILIEAVVQNAVEHRFR